ncbi:RHS repeat protein [Stenotrophomonas cyclobalanopsidis]|uniref:RHS repeat protein n=1 Tax=Stenotrophomonas cyclobalanopsidis TaxID=2771362 RepID=UPI00345F3083
MKNDQRHLLQWIVLIAALGSGPIWAAEPYQEYNKRIETAQSLTALKDGLMGDSISLYNGVTEFSVTDVELSGSGLPIRLTRRLTIDVQPYGPGEPLTTPKLAGLGNWDVDVPYISGTFDAANLWRGLNSSGGITDQRCSVIAAPAISFSGPMSIFDIWQGNTVHLPGGGDRAMLLAEAGVPQPTDGVSRRWTSRERDAFNCIPMQGGMSGEGFSMLTTEGIRYDFNLAVTRFAGTMRQSRGPMHPPVSLTRTKVYLLATKVTDRFGNRLDYTYNSQGSPTSIIATDATGEIRRVDMAYAGDRLASATANGRTWGYEYDGAGLLSGVTLPDGSRWQYAYAGNLRPSFDYWDGETGTNCASGPGTLPANYQVTSVHPSGATAVFSFENMRHYRSGVQRSECVANVSGSDRYYVLRTPNRFDVMSLTEKQISGPGLSAPLKWTYNYTRTNQPLVGQGQPVPYPCTTCPKVKDTTVMEPDGSRTVHRYGFLYHHNDGQLVGTDVYNAAGTLISSRTTETMSDAQVAGQPFRATYGLHVGGDDPGQLQVRPVTGTIIQQDGATYRSVVNSFDDLARPVTVTRSNPWHSRTDVTEYRDDRAGWILGAVAKRTNLDTGLVESQVSFDPKIMPLQTWSFGKLTQSLSYYGDGTVATVADGAGNTTTLSSWKRGTPQSIRYADGTSVAATVDDSGWITSTVDENGFTTSYGYDRMGRVVSIAYPSNDTVAWNALNQSFAPSPGAAYGLAAGHWKQTVATGNLRKETYFDAFWRPVLSREYDASNVDGTQRFRRFAYDEFGREVFASYPGASEALSAGLWTEYDVLGRTTSTSQDSEQGLLTTTTQYIGDNQTRVTNPRGQVTISRFQAFDTPEYSSVTAIQHPEGAFTDIVRDVFGKPTTIRRRNADGSQDVTRSYVYDAQQQLCKSIEPETGATAFGYDAAGNLAWSASGLVLPSASSCDAEAAYASGRRADRSFDARNRLKTLVFPDGKGNQAWSYTNDGKPTQIVSRNDAGAEATTTYTYNRRRLLTAESLAQTDAAPLSLGYGYDANAVLSAIVYPSGMAVEYAPNALGQATKAGSYATGVGYYPNGGMSRFTYGNGVVHSMSQNARQLPQMAADGSSVVNHTYSYDAVGNVTLIADGIDSARSRSMQYDGLDRLVQASSPSFGGDGVMKYTYDVLDNIRSAKLGGGKQHSYFYDSSNRLTNVQDNQGATTIGLSFDVQGNLARMNGKDFIFDFGNRLRSAAGKEQYRYDGHGRRTFSIDTTSGGKILSMYGNDGALRWQSNQRTGETYEYVHLNGSLIAKTTAFTAPIAPTVTTPAFSSNGAYSVTWSAAINASRYELQERVGGGAWAGVYSGAARSWSAAGKQGGTYEYRVQACHGTACSNWSVVASTVVQQPPSGISSLALPSDAPNGSYSVSWTAVAGAASYRLEEQVDTGAWQQAQNSGALMATFSGKAAGTYSYRVSGCNTAGCGPASAVMSTRSYYPPTAVANVSAPSLALNGSYSVTWPAVAGAKRYQVEESIEGAGWTVVAEQSTEAVSFSGKSTGSYRYRVLAGNGAGWGANYSNVVTVSSLQPPQGTSVSVPASSNSGSYQVSWNAVPMASEYRLEQSANGGGWQEIQREGSTLRNVSGADTGTYAYRVLACNQAGCSGYSNTVSIAVSLPPATPSMVSTKRIQTARPPIRITCNAQWTAVPNAITYELLRDGNNIAYTGPETRVTAANTNYCATTYQVRACNAGGCSPWSTPPMTQVLEIRDGV